MIKLFCVIFLILNLFHTNAQDSISLVKYKLRLIEKENKVSQTKARKDFFNEVSKNLLNIECELTFNSFYSNFKVINKLSNNDNDFALKTALNFVGGEYIKNIRDTLKIKRVEVAGSKFIVKYDFNEYKWEITNESKNIDGFICYKAICKFEEFDKYRNKSLVFTPEVWFTPSLPYPYGPKGLDGLPGLVLEGRFNERFIFYATSIKLNINSDSDFTKINKQSTMINHEQYLDILQEINLKSTTK